MTQTSQEFDPSSRSVISWKKLERKNLFLSWLSLTTNYLKMFRMVLCPKLFVSFELSLGFFKFCGHRLLIDVSQLLFHENNEIHSCEDIRFVFFVAFICARRLIKCSYISSKKWKFHAYRVWITLNHTATFRYSIFWKWSCSFRNRKTPTLNCFLLKSKQTSPSNIQTNAPGSFFWHAYNERYALISSSKIWIILIYTANWSKVKTKYIPHYIR